MREKVIVETGLSTPYFFVVIEGGFIVESGFDEELLREDINSQFAVRLKNHLLSYFFKHKALSHDSYPIRFKTSKFSMNVLEEVKKIPYGETKTYKEIAEKIGIKGYRAVGRALSLNPVPIIIPCHRVVGSRDLGGYMGKKGNSLKKELLMLEKG